MYFTGSVLMVASSILVVLARNKSEPLEAYKGMFSSSMQDMAMMPSERCRCGRV
jgi:hypothetical protein